MIQRRFSYKRVLEMGVSGVMGVTSLVRDAPQHIDQLLLDLNAGQLRFQVENDKLEELGAQLNVVATRVSMALIAVGLLISAAILVKDDPWSLWGVPWATVSALCTAVFLSLVGLAWHAIGAGNGKLSLGFLTKLLSRRRKLE